MASSEYLIEPLDPKKHDQESFICEEPALNEFIRKHANRESKANTSKCFVLSVPKALQRFAVTTPFQLRRIRVANLSVSVSTRHLYVI
jgi:hypothetical protein